MDVDRQTVAGCRAAKENSVAVDTLVVAGNRVGMGILAGVADMRVGMGSPAAAENLAGELVPVGTDSQVAAGQTGRGIPAESKPASQEVPGQLVPQLIEP